jgi:hypothetical protein
MERNGTVGRVNLLKAEGSSVAGTNTGRTIRKCALIKFTSLRVRRTVKAPLRTPRIVSNRTSRVHCEMLEWSFLFFLSNQSNEVRRICINTYAQYNKRWELTQSF